MNFATSLKHKKQVLGVASLLGLLMLKNGREQKTLVTKEVNSRSVDILYKILYCIL